MTDKIMTAEKAVEKFINNSDQIALGGFTVNRNPMHIIREIIRQKKNKLYLVVHSHGQGMELLIGAGCKELFVSMGFPLRILSRQRLPEKLLFPVKRLFRKIISAGTRTKIAWPIL